jgi:hypothetical protein
MGRKTGPKGTAESEYVRRIWTENQAKVLAGLEEEMTDEAIAAEVASHFNRVYRRQSVQKVLGPKRKRKAPFSKTTQPRQNGETQFAGASTSAVQPAAATQVIGPDRLALGAAFQLVVVEWPAWADAPEAIASRHSELDVDRLQALVTYRMNATSKAGAWKAVGIDPETGGDMYRRDKALRRVLDWAVGLSEVKIAANMLRLASGNGPQAAQAATLVAERQLGWSKESTLHIEGQIREQIDVQHMLANPRWIELMSEAEAIAQGALPAHQADVIDAEVIKVRPDENRPPLPNDEGMTKHEPVVFEQPEPVRRMNRPGQTSAEPGRTRTIIVDGIKTLVVDERADGDDRPAF